MKRTIEMLKEDGFFESMVKFYIDDCMDKEDMETLLSVLLLDKKLQEQWIKDAHQMGMDYVWYLIEKEAEERKAVEALKDVDPDALFEKATKKTEKTEKNETLQEVKKILQDVLKNLDDDLK